MRSDYDELSQCKRSYWKVRSVYSNCCAAGWRAKEYGSVAASAILAMNDLFRRIPEPYTHFRRNSQDSLSLVHLLMEYYPAALSEV
jgi:hypothetical protein